MSLLIDVLLIVLLGHMVVLLGLIDWVESCLRHFIGAWFRTTDIALQELAYPPFMIFIVRLILTLFAKQCESAINCAQWTLISGIDDSDSKIGDCTYYSTLISVVVQDGKICKLLRQFFKLWLIIRDDTVFQIDLTSGQWRHVYFVTTLTVSELFSYHISPPVFERRKWSHGEPISLSKTWMSHMVMQYRADIGWKIVTCAYICSYFLPEFTTTFETKRICTLTAHSVFRV